MVALTDDLQELHKRIARGESAQSKHVQRLVDRLAGKPITDAYLGGPDMGYVPDPGSDDALDAGEAAYEATQDAPTTFGHLGRLPDIDDDRRAYAGPVDGERVPEGSTGKYGLRFTRTKLPAPVFVAGDEISVVRWSGWEPTCECSPTTRRTSCCWMHDHGTPHSCNNDTTWDSLLTHWSRKDPAGYRWRREEAKSQAANAIAGIPEPLARSMTAGRRAVLGYSRDDIFRPLSWAPNAPNEFAEWRLISKTGRPCAFGCLPHDLVLVSPESPSFGLSALYRWEEGAVPPVLRSTPTTRHAARSSARPDPRCSSSVVRALGSAPRSHALRGRGATPLVRGHRT